MRRRAPRRPRWPMSPQMETAISRPTAQVMTATRRRSTDRARLRRVRVHSRWPTPPPPSVPRPLPRAWAQARSARAHWRSVTPAWWSGRVLPRSVLVTPPSAPVPMPQARMARPPHWVPCPKPPPMARPLSAAVPWRWARAAPHWAAAPPPPTKRRSQSVRSALLSVNTAPRWVRIPLRLPPAAWRWARVRWPTASIPCQSVPPNTA